MTDKSAVKLILIGDSGTGKSSLLLSYTEQRFLPTEEAIATVGVDFRLLKKEYQGVPYKVYIWDTAGQERFRTLTSSFYRGASVVFVVFDVGSRESFANLESWFTEVKLYCADRPVFTCVVANKIDVDASERQVSPEEGEAYAKAHGADYCEVSAKTMAGVAPLFDAYAERVASDPDRLRGASATGTGAGGASSPSSPSIQVGADGGGGELPVSSLCAC